ncbi:MAG: cyclic nucleotide-binding domain-containing protein [Oscillatoriales cyanobacterium RM2_1_1]|nr:cyclic nucleotide-binding domain-containing protein [Oscillatoriales cyanobacterium SM2_3_0]NJO46891.1 cyclic nucleotide-binding domain-containing protein [Oscillatoriales cyanobacterium RM2_1_1]
MIQKPDSLLNLGIFKAFYTEEIEMISEYISLHRFYDLQEIMPQKEKATSFGIVLSGEVNITDDYLDNPSRIAGDFLGELSLLDSAPREADFIAASDGFIAIMTFDDIEKLKIRCPYLAVKLVHCVTHSGVQHFKSQGFDGVKDGIALISGETQIPFLINWVQENSHFLSTRPVCTTAAIAEALHLQTSITVHHLINDQHLVGGTEAIGSQILLGHLGTVIALRNPLDDLFNSENLEAISRLCDLHNILFTTNQATAEIFLDILESIE